jgi:hypothetical protein
MAALRGPEVLFDPSFKADLDGLRKHYPDIDSLIKELADLLERSFQIPEMAVGSQFPNAYAINLDYPPKGEAGIHQFLVVYHATDATPSMNMPYRTYTLLGIKDRRPPS